MGTGLGVLCAGLGVTVLLLLLKIAVMRKSAREIASRLLGWLDADTNTLISVSSNDKAMNELAAALNKQLRLLRSQRRRYIQGDTELKNAVTGISHDLRTPLTAISGYLDLMEGMEKSGEIERCLSVIRGRTRALETLTEELFRYSVITSPEYDLSQREVVDVKAVLEESILDYYAALNEKGIAPKIQMPPKRVNCLLNRGALSRIFSNLMNNAMKYSDGDLEITLTEEGQVIFANTAKALSKIDTERIFDRFYTVETARRSTGLGLSIARSLLEQMGGSVEAFYEEQRLSIVIGLPGYCREKSTGRPAM